MKIIESSSKLCPCGKTFYRKHHPENKKQWEKRKYCCNACRFKFFEMSLENKMKFYPKPLENHPRWKNGIHRTPILIRLLEREGIDTTKCSICNTLFVEEYKRHIHHLDKNRKNNDIANLRIVCVPCHKRLDGYGFYTDYAKEHNIPVGNVWNMFNRERVHASGKEYYLEHRAKILERSKENYEKRKNNI